MSGSGRLGHYGAGFFGPRFLGQGGFREPQHAARLESLDEIEALHALHAAYPDAIDAANDFLVGVSSQVATGEIAPWDE